nr:MAG TPA: hypothetical protein [Caudoviricetes sp.]
MNWLITTSNSTFINSTLKSIFTHSFLLIKYVLF